jgi:hypothetical protein
MCGASDAAHDVSVNDMIFSVLKQAKATIPDVIPQDKAQGSSTTPITRTVKTTVGLTHSSMSVRTSSDSQDDNIDGIMNVVGTKDDPSSSGTSLKGGHPVQVSLLIHRKRTHEYIDYHVGIAQGIHCGRGLH